MNSRWPSTRTTAISRRRCLPDLLARWLQDPRCASRPQGAVCASSWAIAASEQDATLLANLIDKPELTGGLCPETILAGYTLLRPKEGLQLIHAVLKDRSKVFRVRATRPADGPLSLGQAPGVVARQDLLDGFLPVPEPLGHGRPGHRRPAPLAAMGPHWRASWPCSKKESHWEMPILRRAVLRYSLCCPRPEARSLRRTDAQTGPRWVEEMEEMLQPRGRARIEAGPIDS